MKYFFILLFFVSLITPAAAGSAGSPLTYTVNDQPYEGYYINHSPGAPLVILMHDWDGLTGYEIKRAQMLAKIGYSVFAADLFGAGIRPTEVKDKKQHTGELYKNRKQLRSLLYGALEAAKTQGLNTDQAVAIGYCFGGAAVLEFARSGADLKGFVTFHGGLSTPEGQDYSKASGSYLILHGTADTNITMDNFAELADQLETNSLNHEMITYSGAPHAFTVFGSPRYRQDADEKSWQRLTEFLASTLR